MLKGYRFIALFFILAGFAGCKKNDTDKPLLIQGKISLYITAVHHYWGVSDIQIYLKKNATEFPGEDPALYDMEATTDKGGNVVFSNLFPGAYFIYAKGYDSIFRDDVYGYAPVSFQADNSGNNEVYYTLYVNERD